MPEKEYIEREAVKEKLSPMLNDPEAVDFWEWQCSEIDDIPAADVRPVVLCRDCKNRFNYDICACRGDDWFCGYGEKR